MVIHIYLHRSHRNSNMRLLCVEGRTSPPVDGEGYTTQAHNATCPKCLDIAIPKLEAYLAKAKASRALSNATE